MMSPTLLPSPLEMGYFSFPFHPCVRGNIFTTAISSPCSQEDMEEVEEKPFSFCPCLLRQGPSLQAPTLNQIACIAVGWLLAPLHSMPGPSYTHARSTMATRQPAELALHSRHPMAVASTSSLGTRLQPRSCAGLPGADAGPWHGASGEHQAVTASAGPMSGCAAGAGLLERGSPSSLEHRSLFHSELPETVRWSVIIDLIHI